MIKIENNPIDIKIKEEPVGNKLKDNVLYLEGLTELMEELQRDAQTQAMQAEYRTKADYSEVIKKIDEEYKQIADKLNSFVVDIRKMIQKSKKQ